MSAIPFGDAEAPGIADGSELAADVNVRTVCAHRQQFALSSWPAELIIPMVVIGGVGRKKSSETEKADPP